MREERVRLRIDKDHIAWVVLMRGARHNAVDMPMLRDMRAMQRRLRGMREVRGAIIHGDGPSFCSGLDFKSVQSSRRDMLRAALALWSPWMNIFQHWSMGWRRMPFPVIAALHGHCYGAGMQLALGADLRIAMPDAQLALLETKWGLVPDMGGPTLLRELMPIDLAKDLLLSGRVMDGAEALRMGLVSRIEAEPLAAAKAQLLTWAQRSPDALAVGKFLLQSAWNASPRAALAAERRGQRRLIGRRNQRIAMRIGAGQAEPGAFAARTIQR